MAHRGAPVLVTTLLTLTGAAAGTRPDCPDPAMSAAKLERLLARAWWSLSAAELTELWEPRLTLSFCHSVDEPCSVLGLLGPGEDDTPRCGEYFWLGTGARGERPLARRALPERPTS